MFTNSKNKNYQKSVKSTQSTVASSPLHPFSENSRNFSALIGGFQVIFCLDSRIFFHLRDKRYTEELCLKNGILVTAELLEHPCDLAKEILRIVGFKVFFSRDWSFQSGE